jgi:iron complex transport system ATP-binding protein
MTLKVQGLELVINNKILVSDINFEFKTGQVISILGSNGSGKTTLLKSIAGLKDIENNCVFINGQDIKNLSSPNLATLRAYMSQSLHNSFAFTALQIIQMGNYNSSEDIIFEISKKLQITQFLQRDFTSLSGGEKQRVHLAQVLLQVWDKKNVWLMLDEPFSAQDLKYQFLVADLLKDLASFKQWGILLINHIFEISEKISDQFMAIHDKKIQIHSEILEEDKKIIYEL